MQCKTTGWACTSTLQICKAILLQSLSKKNSLRDKAAGVKTIYSRSSLLNLNFLPQTVISMYGGGQERDTAVSISGVRDLVKIDEL